MLLCRMGYVNIFLPPFICLRFQLKLNSAVNSAFSCLEPETFHNISPLFSYYCKHNILNQLMFRFIPAFAWACLIAVLCLLPQSAFYSPEFLHKLPLDKTVHFGMFFILSVLTWRGMQPKLPVFKYPFFILLAVLIAYGGLTELAQGWFTKTRHTEMLDFLADIVGLVFGFLFYLLVLRRISNRRELVKY